MPGDSYAVKPEAMVLAEQTQLRIPTNLDWIQPTAEYLKNKALQCAGCEESQAGRILLALHEALTNSLIHGNLEVSSKLKEEDNDHFARKLTERSADPFYAGRAIHIGFDYNGERCQWSITDEGPGFDFEAVLSRPEPSPEDLWAPSGRGIQLIRALVDEIRYEANGRRVLLTLRRSAHPEKREHARWPLHQRVQVAPIRADGSVDWDAAYDAVTQNLSHNGLGLLQSHMTRAERVLIGIDVDGRTIYVPAQVRHCKPVQKDMLELGCRFLLPEEVDANVSPSVGNLDEALDALLGRLHTPPSDEDERRAHRRAVYTERIEIAGRGGKPDLYGYARDISKGGIAFIATEAFSPQEHILSLPLSGQATLRVRAQVVRCLAIVEGFYDVAARFVGLA